MPAVPRMERDGGVERAQVRKVVFLRRTKSSQSEEKEDITGESVQMVVVSQERESFVVVVERKLMRQIYPVRKFVSGWTVSISSAEELF